MTADRGIGNSPKLLGEVAGLGMFCLMRAAKKVRAMMVDGEVSPFDELSDAPGTSWRRRARAFKNSGRIERWADAQRNCGRHVAGGALTCSTCACSVGAASSVRLCS